jgi:hypothetical protein
MAITDLLSLAPEPWHAHTVLRVISWRSSGRQLGVVVVVVALIGVAIYWVAFRQTPPGPGWIKVGSVDDVHSQHVTKVGDSAYVVSYGDLPPFAFAASYEDVIHETLYYCPSSGWFFNEPHATLYDIVGKYKVGPDPSSTLPRVAVTVLDGNVWVDPAQAIPGLVPGAEGVHQPAEGPFCQDVQELSVTRTG